MLEQKRKSIRGLYREVQWQLQPVMSCQNFNKCSFKHFPLQWAILLVDSPLHSSAAALWSLALSVCPWLAENGKTEEHGFSTPPHYHQALVGWSPGRNLCPFFPLLALLWLVDGDSIMEETAQVAGGGMCCYCRDTVNWDLISAQGEAWVFSFYEPASSIKIVPAKTEGGALVWI